MNAHLQGFSGLVVVTANCSEFDLYEKNLTTIISASLPHSFTDEYPELIVFSLFSLSDATDI